VFEKKDDQTTLNHPEPSPSGEGREGVSGPDTTEQTPLPPPEHEEFIKDFEELVNSIAQNIYQGSLSPQLSEKFDELSAAIRESIESIGASMEKLIKWSREVEATQGILRSATQDITKRLEAIDGQVGTKIIESENKLREELVQQHVATKGDIAKEMGEVEGRTTRRLVYLQEGTGKKLDELEQRANSQLDATTESLKKLTEEVGRQGSAQAGFAHTARQEFLSQKRLLWALITVPGLSLAGLAVYWFMFR